MCEDWHGGEGLLECVKGAMTLLRKIPRSVLPGEPGQGYHNVGVIKYKLAVKVCESEEGLDVLYLSRLRPVTDRGDLIWGHGQTIREEVISKIFD